MRINRSSKCSLKFANAAKREVLVAVMEEYAKVVNFFITRFWGSVPSKAELLKPVVDLPSTWLSARLRKVAAREAIDMVKASKERFNDKAKVPTHKGNRMCLSSTIASLNPANGGEFDAWLHISSIGNGIILDIPIRPHRHFNRLAANGRRLESYVVSKDSVQFCFEIETGHKKIVGNAIGVDTGINALASLSDGRQFGLDTKAHIERIKRSCHGSKGQKKARRALRQRMDEVAKQVVSGDVALVVVEKLKDLNKNTKLKRRLNRNMRRSIGSWAWRYWLERLQRECENRCSAFHSVFPAYTSQGCLICGHVDRRNRQGEKFLCRKCGHTDNADTNAARNILQRFLSGPYGAGFKTDGIICQK